MDKDFTIADCEKFKKAEELLKSVSKYVDDEDSLTINNMIDKYSERLTNYNIRNTTIINPTKKEIAMVKRSSNIALECRVFADITAGYGVNYHIFRKYKKLIKNYDLPNWYLNAKILLKRQSGGHHNFNSIQRETNEILLNELVKEFINKNKKQVKQIFNDYETSKQ